MPPPERPLILFAHGAGVPSTSPWMQAWKARLETLGRVQPFDYPYAAAGRKRPDPLPKLIAAHRAALDEARAHHPGAPVVLAGKSMGSRVGCHLANEPDVAPLVRAIVCFGYPLAGGTPGALRDEVLLGLRAPILFLQGTRDRLCPLEELEKVRARMTARSVLHVVGGGDHSLLVTAGRSTAAVARQAEADRATLEAVRAFLGETGAAPGAGAGVTR